MYWFSTSTTTFQEIFQLKITMMIIWFFNNSIKFFQLINFFSNNSACDFGPSGELRMTSPSSFGVLIPRHIFWKIAKIVDRRFSVTLQQNFAFRWFNFESERFFFFNNCFEIFQSGSVIIT